MLRQYLQAICLSSLMLSCACIPSTSNETSSSGGRVLACYYMAASFFPASQVPADLCTHIIYAFGEVTPEGIKPTKSGDIQNYRTVIGLKKKNPSLKVLLSLQSGFPSVVSSGTAAMKSFALSAVKFLTSYGFDGVDLDWEFPKATDKKNFAQFIQILHSVTSKAQLLLSAAIPNNRYSFKGFDVDSLSRYMDFMTAMTYDFHLYIKGVDNITGYNSPLYTPNGESIYFSTSELIDYFLGDGIPPSKLLMGIPTYGRSWLLADASNHGLHAPAIGKGGPSPYRHIPNIYLYPDVCAAQQQGAHLILDKTNGAAYLYQQDTWVAYEGIQTVAYKMSWMKSKNLGGVGVWALHLDDNDGVCKSGFLPLISAIKSGL